MDSVRKEVEIHSVHSAHGAPIARLRSRFGFPPPAEPTPPAPSAPTQPDPPADVSPWDLPADLFERWEDRVCIMHFDGKIPWKQAEALALADILRIDEAERKAGPAPETPPAKEMPVQPTLFAADEEGPYR